MFFMCFLGFFFLGTLYLYSITFGCVSGEHAAAMPEEHAGQLHQAQAHHTRRIHLRWTRVLDTAGQSSFFF